MAIETLVESPVVIASIITALGGALGLPKLFEYLKLRHENRITELKEEVKASKAHVRELEKEIELEKEKRQTERDRRVNVENQNKLAINSFSTALVYLRILAKDNPDILTILDTLSEDINITPA